MNKAAEPFKTLFMQNFVIFGYSRTKMNDEELRNMISRTLTCRIDQRFFHLFQQRYLKTRIANV